MLTTSCQLRFARARGPFDCVTTGRQKHVGSPAHTQPDTPNLPDPTGLTEPTEASDLDDQKSSSMPSIPT